jgi:hypothetical protein
MDTCKNCYFYCEDECEPDCINCECYFCDDDRSHYKSNDEVWREVIKLMGKIKSGKDDNECKKILDEKIKEW